MQGSRVELRKVVWPTRQETLQTTLVVFVAILAMGIFFWILDWILGSVTAALTGQGRLTVALRWYVVHAYSNFEHKVSESLKERIKLKGLEDKFGEILVPTEEVVEMRDGQRRSSERKFFPGYVLVQMEMNEDTWHLVRETAEGARLHRRHAGEAGADHRPRGERDPAPRRGRRREAAAEGAVRARRGGARHRAGRSTTSTASSSR